MTRARTHFLARGTALGLPPWGGGGSNSGGTHPQPIENSREYQRTSYNTQSPTLYCPSAFMVHTHSSSLDESKMASFPCLIVPCLRGQA